MSNSRSFRSKNIGSIGIALGAWFGVLLVTGCGNTLKSNVSRSLASTTGQSVSFGWNPDTLSAANSSNNSEYLCPTEANVKPEYRWGAADEGLYSACSNKNSVNKIRIKGRPRNEGSRLCVFPAQVIDPTDPSQSQKVLAKPGLDGLPMLKCGHVGTVGLDVEFQNTIFNAVFIVDEDVAQDMRTCLLTSQSWQCPRDWSFGRFRTK